MISASEAQTKNRRNTSEAISIEIPSNNFIIFFGFHFLCVGFEDFNCLFNQNTKD